MKPKNIKLREQMYNLLLKWKQSEMTLVDFSKSEAISYGKLKYWKRIFKNSNQAGTCKSPHLSKEIPDFISIQVPDLIADFPDLEIIYPNNVKLRCPSGLQADTLKTLIKLF